jgi:hypothetical protein
VGNSGFIGGCRYVLCVCEGEGGREVDGKVQEGVDDAPGSWHSRNGK